MTEVIPGTRVVATNPRHVNLGIGVVHQVRGAQAKVEFRPTVFSQPPYLTESRILNVDELRVVKTPIERLGQDELDEPWRFDLRTRAAHLLVCNREGQLSNARTDLLPHQISVAHKVVSNPRQRFLIADEVGLGKTIEAGMVLYALRQRGQARRVLIITPAGLTLQWQEEMEDKFSLEFAVYREDVDGPLAFDRFDYLVASVDTLKLDRPLKSGKREGHKTMVLGARDWDVIIFDEAHKLSAKTWSPQKTEKTLNYRLAEDLQDRCRTLLLLTATPHQGDESKFQNLMSLLHYDITFEEYAGGDGEHGPIPFTDLVLRNRKSKVTDAEGNPIFKGMDVHPVRVNLLNSGERKFHKALEIYLREGYGYADQDPKDKRHKAIGFVMTTFQKLAASSTRAIKQALQRRLDNLRHAIKERDIQREVEHDARHEGEYEERRVQEITESFVEAEVEMIENLISLNVPEDAKQTELFSVIDSVSRDNPRQRVLIFTEYLGTQDLIVELLEERYGGGCTSIIRGGMSLWEKKKSIEAFRDIPRVRFLVSTEAGGEGINLQFAHVMINYDLPWNPFRLAHRYGRLYRYGQDRVVQVFNFQNAGTIEDRVREYLEAKTKTAAQRLAGITGETVEEIEEGLLGLFDELLDYEKVYRDGLAKGDLKPSKAVIDEGIKNAERAYEMAYASLFSKDISPFNPERFKHEIQSPLTLDDVQEFIGNFVKRNGRNFTQSEDGTWEFLLPECLKDVQGLEKRYRRVTFYRKEAIRHSELQFMAVGHPLTDAAIQHCGTADFGGLATAVTVKDSNLAPMSGLYCIFMVKLTIGTSDGEVTQFDLVPLFMESNGTKNRDAADLLLRNQLQIYSQSKAQWSGSLDLDSLYELAVLEVMQQYEKNNLWEEDISCLNAALVEFVN